MMARDSGCSLRNSMASSRTNTSCSEWPPTGWSSRTSGSPRVITPVLSKATARSRASSSRWEPPLTSTPCRVADVMAAAIVTGVEITSPHGHEMSRMSIAW